MAMTTSSSISVKAAWADRDDAQQRLLQDAIIRGWLVPANIRRLSLFVKSQPKRFEIHEISHQSLITDRQG
jgi:hypothetical protein